MAGREQHDTDFAIQLALKADRVLNVEQVAGLVAPLLGWVPDALAQDDVKRILSFHIVSQIGYMLMGLGIFTVAGVAGAILFIVHKIPVKTVLFLAGGLVEAEHGIGLEKKAHLHISRNTAELEVMKRLKALFDPKGTLNPGKIFPADAKRFHGAC